MLDSIHQAVHVCVTHGVPTYSISSRNWFSMHQISLASRIILRNGASTTALVRFTWEAGLVLAVTSRDNCHRLPFFLLFVSCCYNQHCTVVLYSVQYAGHYVNLWCINCENVRELSRACFATIKVDILIWVFLLCDSPLFSFVLASSFYSFLHFFIHIFSVSVRQSARISS